MLGIKESILTIPGNLSSVGENQVARIAKKEDVQIDRLKLGAIRYQQLHIDLSLNWR